MIEKNQLILQNDMNEKWRTIYKESDGLSLNLENLLKSDHKTIKQIFEIKRITGAVSGKGIPTAFEYTTV